MCDCTLCAKKGYLWLNAPPDSLEVTRDEGSITVYRSSALEDKVRVMKLQRNGSGQRC
jgi:hypothetical protein